MALNMRHEQKAAKKSGSVANSAGDFGPMPGFGKLFS
jgi:hypothetical protein